jgi:hypothetical protein
MRSSPGCEEWRVDPERGRRLLHDLEHLTALAWSVLGIAEKEAEDQPLSIYALAIFKGICLTADAVLRLHPDSSYSVPWGRKVWNPTSAAALARVIVEATINLHYFAVDDVSPEERQFRFIIANLHGAREDKDTAALIDAMHPEEGPVPDDWSGLDLRQQHEMLPRLMRKQAPRKVEFWEGELRRNAYFARLSPAQQAKWLPGKRLYDRNGRYRGGTVDAGFVLPRIQRAERAGVVGPLYRVQQRHLSSHVHVAPHAVEQIRAFMSHDQIAIASLVHAPMALCASYLARATSYVLDLFPRCQSGISRELLLVLLVYAALPGGDGTTGRDEPHPNPAEG